MGFSKEFIKGSTVSMILSVLRDGDLYGYEIIKSIKARSEDALNLGEGTVYPILHRLEKKGYLSSRWEKQQGAPDRKYYSITESGIKLLGREMDEWREFSEAVNKVTGNINFSK
jgi:PadR family transcriptional regulator PadR